MVATVKSLLTDPFVSTQSYLHVFQSPLCLPKKLCIYTFPCNTILKRKLNFSLFSLSLSGNPLIGNKIWLSLQINQNMAFCKSQTTAGTKKGTKHVFYRKHCSVLEALHNLLSKSWIGDYDFRSPLDLNSCQVPFLLKKIETPSDGGISRCIT